MYLKRSNADSLGEGGPVITQLLMSGDILPQDIFAATPNDQYFVSIKPLDAPLRTRSVAGFH